jgi:hypothetical protein
MIAELLRGSLCTPADIELLQNVLIQNSGHNHILEFLPPFDEQGVMGVFAYKIQRISFEEFVFDNQTV